MQWKEWSDEAFEGARERRVPVLLFLYTSWCRYCHELEARTFDHEGVREALTTRAVCIRVDKDRRPDIDTRYRGSGWPTLAWLDPAAESLARDGYLEPDGLLERLEEIEGLVARATGNPPATQAHPIEQGTAENESPPGESELIAPPVPAGRTRPRRHDAPSLELVEDILETLLAGADPVHGGWGQRHKFPHPEALQFCLVRWSQTGDGRVLDVVTRTLRHMLRGEIYDRVEGGFYRYATEADWSGAHHEKMLDSNAQRSAALFEAWQALGEESFLDSGQAVIAWMNETLLNEELGAYRGSQDADPEYARLATREARAKRGAPPCDPTIFANWNAMAVSALLKAGAVTGEEEYTARALRTLDFLVTELWDDRQGMYHYWDGTYNLPGLLTDQAYTLRALVDATHFAGRTEHLELAERLAKLTIEHLQAEDGSFYDTRYDPGARGGLRVRNNSILENSVMAEALLRLAAMTRDESYAERAKEALTAFLPDFRRFGHFTAGFGRAIDLLVHEPVQVTIVGARDSELLHQLRRAALAPYVASRIVLSLDPERDARLFESSGLPVPEDVPARAYVQQGRESYAETSRPERLPALLSRAERSN